MGVMVIKYILSWQFLVSVHEGTPKVDSCFWKYSRHGGGFFYMVILYNLSSNKCLVLTFLLSFSVFAGKEKNWLTAF